jgi:hypothetical protein
MADEAIADGSMRAQNETVPVSDKPEGVVSSLFSTLKDLLPARPSGRIT